ncbi:MAG: histidine kinase [Melioribacter sp.]|nr:histidine kinase [Melioribacter sp.]
MLIKLKNVIDSKLFLPLFIVLSFVSLINSLQTYYVYRKISNSVVLLLITKLIYNWYFILIAIVVMILVNKRSLNFFSLVGNTGLVVFLIVFHQLLAYNTEEIFLVRKSFKNFSQYLFNNPLVWLDVVMIIFFYISFYLIKYREQLKENELKANQLKEKLSLVKLKELKSKIDPNFLTKSLNKISELVEEGKTSEANNLLTLLSEFLREILYYDKEVLKLGDEINLIEKYLMIERVLTNRRLNFTIKGDIEKENLEISTFSILHVIKSISYIINSEISFELLLEDENVDFVILNIFFKDLELEKNVFDKVYLLFENNQSLNLTSNNNSVSISIKLKEKALQVEGE